MEATSDRQFTDEDRRNRAFTRLSVVLYGLWEEGQDAHTRLFETMIPDAFVVCGTSKQGSHWREHAVPCAELRSRAYSMFDKGGSIEEVSIFLREHLKIYRISRDERRKLDIELGLKTRMPEGWEPGDHFARLRIAGVKLHEQELSSNSPMQE